MLYEDINAITNSKLKSNYEIDFISLFLKYQFPLNFLDENLHKFSKKEIEILCSKQKLNEDFIERNSKFLDWNIISQSQKLSENFIIKHIDKLNWKLISIYQILSENFIDFHSSLLDWDMISSFQTLSEDFIIKHIDKINFNFISTSKKLSENFISKYSDKLPMSNITANQILSEQFMRDNISKIDLYEASSHQFLSEKFICDFENTEYGDHFNWYDISMYQKLSEDFIESHLDKLYMPNIAHYQHLSEHFILKHSNLFDWYTIVQYQDLQEKTLNQIIDNFDLKKDGFLMNCILSYNKFSNEFLAFHNITDERVAILNNWLYKSTEEKKQLVIDTELYECYDDYFIAYKAIRSDRYSLFNFQYKYEKGMSYYSKCDCTNAENSFGFGVGSKQFAENYGDCDLNSIIVRCKVKYEDVGRIVHDGDKIRCFNIEILD